MKTNLTTFPDAKSEEGRGEEDEGGGREKEWGGGTRKRKRQQDRQENAPPKPKVPSNSVLCKNVQSPNFPGQIYLKKRLEAGRGSYRFAFATLCWPLRILAWLENQRSRRLS